MQKGLNLNEELLVVGTGESILQYADSLNDIPMPILAWGDSCYFLYHHGIIPSYYGFLDPFTSINYLKLVKDLDVQICVFAPMHTSNYSTMLEYIGTPDIYNVNTAKFHAYKKTLAQCCPKYVPTITVQKLSKNKDPIVKTIDNKDANKRFSKSSKVIVIGSAPNPKGDPFKQKFMDLEENRLTMAILPLVHYLGYRSIFLLGFDGRGGRFHKKNITLKQIHQGSYDRYLPRWLEWKKFHHMDIYLTGRPTDSILIKYLPFKKVLNV